MKSILGISIVLLLALTISCSGTSLSVAETGPETNIGFMQSANHFVKNTYKGTTNPSYLLIRSYSTFDSLFGVGATMGMDKSKLITEEKMKTGFVLSIIYQGNNIQEFNIDKITLKNNRLYIYFTSKVTTPNASWTCNCHVTALIDDCEFESVLFLENGHPLHALVKEL